MRAANRPPAPGTALLGRAAELADLADLVHTARLVTLTGPPGVGKTRLAIAAAAAAADRFTDGAVWVDLTPVNDPRVVGDEIARVIEAGFDRDVLLVLDNCEHVLDAADDIGDVLARTTRLHILATSRERLRLSAEHDYAVPPLQMPAADDVPDAAALRSNPAMALLLDRAPAGVKLGPHTARSLVDVCVRLDGLPLALELAAARLRVFTPAELAFRLEHRMASLAGGPRDAPARHRDLRAAIAWSYDLLSERDRAVFRRLSVFPSDWTIEAAAEVCAEPDIVDAVESLLEKHLVQRVGDADSDDTRFSILKSLREFAAEQLDEREGTLARDRHADFFVDGAQKWEETIGTDAENTTWTIVGTIRADLLAALDHRRAGGIPDGTLWLATAIGWYRFTRGMLADSDRLVEEIIAPAIREGASADPRTAALLIAGVLSYAHRDTDAATDLLLSVDDIARDRGDERRRAISSAFLGHLARDRGDFDEAGAWYETTRAIYKQQHNVRGLAWAAHDLGLLAVAGGQHQIAIEQLRKALMFFEHLDYPWAIASSARALAAALLRTGAIDEAGAAYQRALTLHSTVGDRRGIAECLEGLAEVAFRCGGPARATRLVGAAEAQRRKAAVPPNDAEHAHLQELTTRLRTGLGPSAFDHEVQAGRTMPFPSVLEFAASVASPEHPDSPVRLTARQWQVAELVAAGSTNRQIGRQLGISEKTTEIHLHNIMTRTRTTSRAGVAAWTVRNESQRTP